MKKVKIGIFHYRVGKTDGVSLEIEKRWEILHKNNCETKLIAGPKSKKADYVIRELEWDSDEITEIKKNSFAYYKEKTLSDEELKLKIEKIAEKIKKELKKIQIKEKFDYILVHNIFSFGGHLPASKGFTDWIKEDGIKCLATSHDFYWEREEFKRPRNKYIKKYLKKYMPPSDPNIQHIVINSIAQKELKKHSGIKADIMGDVFKFKQPTWKKDDFNKNFRKKFNINPEDIVILQATRLLPRKGIEIAIEYTRELQLKIDKLVGKTIYNGRKINSKSKVILLVAGYAEKENDKYLQKIKKIAKEKKIEIRFISNYIAAKREFIKKNKNKHGVISRKIKKFSLWDAYVYADLVTYPSLWEGWGNQFIEAIFAKKPIAIFEYPVFKSDIIKEGYDVISFGDKFLKNKKTGSVKISTKAMKRAINKIIESLLSEDLQKKLDKNFEIGEKYHNYDVLEKFILNKLLKLKFARFKYPIENPVKPFRNVFWKGERKG